ncbi:hypothetical protein K523DRAFT_288891 [Schizophyllum commune Tattone D]|nr:hypothetical protein K523DRAFT_288891 [Schizophyllum commune Tattone D]
MSPTDAKLSKKQKKALAFRDRKKRGDKGRPEQLDVPEDDIEEQAAEEHAQPGPSKDRAGKRGADAGKGGKEPGEPAAVAPADAGEAADREVAAEGAGAGKTKKGKGKKRAEGEGAEGGAAAGAPKSKKRKREDDVVDGDKEESARPEKKVKQRLILFVGNLKFSTSKEAIQRHFSACEPPPEIRLLTPKTTKPGAAPTKSKGCAFLEFQNKTALQQALKLHQSELEGRLINVELTAGGGGKSEARLNKLKQRNKEMLTRRDKKAAKGNDGAVPERPQRYSATSGLEQATLKKRTWSVPDADDDTTHRGGKKHVRGKKRSKAFSTGMNAIPIG